MFITDHKAFKSATSSLRKELKAIYGDSAPSHAQCLELLAKALGTSGYAAIKVQLPDVAADTVLPLPASLIEKENRQSTKAPRYPLQNLWGDFDLIEPDKNGTLLTGRTFEVIQGTCDTISCVALVQSVSREGSSLEYTNAGQSEVDWDSQSPNTDKDGATYCQTESFEEVSDSACVLGPRGFNAQKILDPKYSAKLRIRTALVDEFFWLAESQAQTELLAKELSETGIGSALLKTLADKLGFMLHPGELPAVIALIAENACE